MTFDKAMSSLRSEDFLLRRDRLRLARPNLDCQQGGRRHFRFDFRFIKNEPKWNYQLSLSPEAGPLDGMGNAVAKEGVLITWVKLAVEPRVGRGNAVSARYR